MTLPSRDRSRVVVIGISSYDDPDLPDLPEVRESALAFSVFATAGEDRLVDIHACDVVVDGRDIPEMGRILTHASREAQDLLLIYYSGHGLIGPRNREFYLGTPQSEWASPEWSSMSYAHLRDVVLSSSARIKIIILDCCFSGRALGGAMSAGSSELTRLDIEGSFVLASSAKDQISLIVHGEKYTAFTGRLLELLRSGSLDVPNPELTLDAVYRVLRGRMQTEGLPTPQMSSSGMVDAGLVRNRAYSEGQNLSAGLETVHSVNQARSSIGRTSKKCVRLTVAAVLFAGTVFGTLYSFAKLSRTDRPEISTSSVSPHSEADRRTAPAIVWTESEVQKLLAQRLVPDMNDIPEARLDVSEYIGNYPGDYPTRFLLRNGCAEYSLASPAIATQYAQYFEYLKRPGVPVQRDQYALNVDVSVLKNEVAAKADFRALSKDIFLCRSGQGYSDLVVSKKGFDDVVAIYKNNHSTWVKSAEKPISIAVMLRLGRSVASIDLEVPDRIADNDQLRLQKAKDVLSIIVKSFYDRLDRYGAM